MAVCLVFPGQGSQNVGMCGDVLSENEKSEKLLEIADDKINFGLSELISNGPIEKLSKTKYSQVSIYTVSCAVFEVVRDVLENINDEIIIAGHSLGEFAAVYAGGGYSFSYGLDLVINRANLMSDASENNKGKMSAILGLNKDIIFETISNYFSPDDVVCANVNTEQQIIISGRVDTVERAKDLLMERGAKKIIDLPVSGAFHSPLMKVAAEKFKELIDEDMIKDSKYKIISNISAKFISTKEEIIKELSNQMCSNVNWLGSVEYAVEKGVKKFIEIGPGNVLTNMIKRINKDVRTINVYDMEAVYGLEGFIRS